MGGNGGLDTFGAVYGKRVENGDMFSGIGLQPIRELVDFVKTGGHAEIPQNLGHNSIAAMIEDHPMKAIIGIPMRIGVIGRRTAKLLDLGTDVGQQQSRDDWQGKRRSFRFDQQTQAQTLKVFTDVDRTNDEISAIAFTNKPFALKALQSLAKWRARNSKGFGQFCLGNFFTTLETAVTNHVRHRPVAHGGQTVPPNSG